jgi:hypothetical protein
MRSSRDLIHANTHLSFIRPHHHHHHHSGSSEVKVEERITTEDLPRHFNHNTISNMGYYDEDGHYHS